MAFPNSAWGRDVFLLVSVLFCAAEASLLADSPPNGSYQISTELVLPDLILKKRGLEFQEVKKEWLRFYTFCLKYCVVLITASGEPPAKRSVGKIVYCFARKLFAMGENLLTEVKYCCRFFGSSSWPDRDTGTYCPFILSMLSFLTSFAKHEAPAKTRYKQ